MKNKIISFFLTFAIIFTFSSCGKTLKESDNKTLTPKNSKAKNESITLLFNKSDSLNPYTSKSENNRNICKLIFEPLIKCDNNFNPVLKIAESVNVEGKTCTVKIKNTVFSDNSKVTANDVVYSFSLAKNYGGLYSTHLYEVTSATVSDSRTVVFNFSRNDPYAKNLLDFPIIKADSDLQTTSDGMLKTPIGCGRFIKKDDQNLLVQNELFFGKKGEIKSIKLIHAPDEDSISHYIEVGASDIYYSDISSSNVARMSGKKCDFAQNNFVYIGINTSTYELKNMNFRYAISAAINRKEICKNAFFNTAIPANGYFHPLVKETSSVQTIKNVSDLEITVENLNKIGYNSKDENGYYVDSNGKRHIFNMIVNKDNRLKVVAANTIASQLKSAGIEMTVTECSFAEYQNRLATGSFELYLGETSILPNHDMSPLSISGGAVAFGVSSPLPQPVQTTEDGAVNPPVIHDPISEIYNEYFKGTATVTDVAATLLTEMVQIPLLYRNGTLFYKDKLSNVSSSESDIYFSIEDYKIK